MSKNQVSWNKLIASMERGSNRIGALYEALTDANRIIKAARDMERCRTQGDIAYVVEECGEEAARSSDSWYEEAVEHEKVLCEALEILDRANEQGYPRNSKNVVYPSSWKH